MQRLIYCPGQERIDEASTLSKQLSLPIVVGESESISFMDFDRNSVSVLCVPEKNNIEFKEMVEQGFHQSIKYSNDFVDLTGDVKVVAGDSEIGFTSLSPILKEKHYCQFVYPCNIVGNHSFSIQLNGTVLQERKYVVY